MFAGELVMSFSIWNRVTSYFSSSTRVDPASSSADSVDSRASRLEGRINSCFRVFDWNLKTDLSDFANKIKLAENSKGLNVETLEKIDALFDTAIRVYGSVEELRPVTKVQPQLNQQLKQQLTNQLSIKKVLQYAANKKLGSIPPQSFYVNGQKYTVADYLGEGAFAAVLKVKDTQGKEYALRVSSMGSPLSVAWHASIVLDSDRPKIQSQYESVQKALGDQDFCLIRGYEIHQTEIGDSTHLLRIELCELMEGELDVGKLSDLDKKKKAAHELASGIDYMHSKEVVHRDIKPANCLMKKDELQIADVDDALVLPQDRGSKLGDVGTPFYRAPEAEINTSNAKAVDVYAVGVSLYEIFAGVPVVEQVEQIVGDTTSSLDLSVIQTSVRGVIDAEKKKIESGELGTDSQMFLDVSEKLLSKKDKEEFFNQLKQSSMGVYRKPASWIFLQALLDVNPHNIPTKQRDLIKNCLQWESAKRPSIKQVLDELGKI